MNQNWWRVALSWTLQSQSRNFSRSVLFCRSKLVPFLARIPFARNIIRLLGNCIKSHYAFHCDTTCVFSHRFHLEIMARVAVNERNHQIIDFTPWYQRLKDLVNRNTTMNLSASYAKLVFHYHLQLRFLFWVAVVERKETWRLAHNRFFDLFRAGFQCWKTNFWEYPNVIVFSICVLRFFEQKLWSDDTLHTWIWNSKERRWPTHRTLREKNVRSRDHTSFRPCLSVLWPILQSATFAKAQNFLLSYFARDICFYFAFDDCEYTMHPTLMSFILEWSPGRDISTHHLVPAVSRREVFLLLLS